MRHRQKGRKLGRDTEHRIAMWRNMAVSLFTHGQITTTIPKAKSVKPFVEKLISAATKDTLSSRRRVMRDLGGDPLKIRDEEDEDVPRNNYGEILKEGGRRQGPRLVQYLFRELGPRYADRPGGYTRIIKLGRWRKGDGADLCVLQLVGEGDSGPQVEGQYSRRREKANRRMERAAQVRKQRQGGGQNVGSDESGAATATVTATATTTATAEADQSQAADDMQDASRTDAATEPTETNPGASQQADHSQGEQSPDDQSKDQS